ncbi:hypothetical protein [Fimbriimonas ginsengisoli]|uniref:Uncharacterized protein n=1 Tax=Fimbriimonas ginsengisoli Gsoil 348 TaxID=661478 RepID=A0A068NX70_FIMGI|nr:hypothetical protein [Fimbriimonas ginsengisoli]AIE88026.1 hypothetical protein OP10G_4658 [Fimbriimonas ginsengisoli Gsoil 348]
MASAYTPGLTVSGDIVVRRNRRLPIKGEVLVQPGALVEPTTVVARAMLPGALQTIKLAEKLGVEAKDVASMLKIEVGQPVTTGQVVAEGKKLFGFFKAPSVSSEFSGTIESVSDVTGNALVREPSIPVDVKAYIQGRIAEVMPEEGAVVETRCAMVQGIFGVGGERTGTIRVAVPSPDKVLEASDIQSGDAGKFLVGGAGVTLDAIQKASQAGVTGLIVGGIKDSDLTKFLGFDIGVAITGSEPIDLTIVVTEGFGFLSMAERTFKLLSSLEGKVGSINGATQIRAGVIRPELIVPIAEDAATSKIASQVFELKEGTPIRVIREPYFGRLGAVTDLPSALVTLESGTEVRVLRARLENGEEVTVPRANVEIIASD